MAIIMGLKIIKIGGSPNSKKLGDYIEKMAKPIAVALKMPCLDENRRLRPESGCGKRKAWLDKMGEKIGIGS